MVSIHAPVWGATEGVAVSAEGVAVSIHAPVWGATNWFRSRSFWRMFQSTPPYGGRRNTPSEVSEVLSFNPRPRMGGDWTATTTPTCH